MAPTVLKEGGFRLLLFSREETRMPVHVNHANGEAKFWLEPAIASAQNFGLSPHQLRTAEDIVRAHEQRIRTAWQQHFGS